ncbi:hypothetical protein ACGFNP_21425 [Nonomuraea sp. NPDC049269]|uniref:hypothetical protein n=1 Tax=Nonomuraea sp. NPDC049269 TaxID=3364349 RepID=UPI00372008DC
MHALAPVDGRPDPAIVHNLLLEIVSRLDSLAANAIAFKCAVRAPYRPQRPFDRIQDVGRWFAPSKVIDRNGMTFRRRGRASAS